MKIDVGMKFRDNSTGVVIAVGTPTDPVEGERCWHCIVGGKKLARVTEAMLLEFYRPHDAD